MHHRKATRILLTLFACVLCMPACTSNTRPPNTLTEAPTDHLVETEMEDATMPETTPIETKPVDTAPVEDPALNVFPTEGENIEIGIFWEPPAEFTTPEQYDWLRDANITFIEATNWRGNIDHEVAQLQVDLARERGMKVVYNIGRDGKTLTDMSPDEIEAYCRELAEDPTIVGVHVIDEPANPWAYAPICAAVSKGGLCPRLNFLPFYVLSMFDNYNGHVEDTIIATGKDYYGYLCYDQYPFPYGGGIPDMFYNMNFIREVGLKYGVDTGLYIQSIGEGGNFRRTDGGEIRYHTSASLAYGYKSLTYFTWWTTGFCEPKDYAIISPYGEKTDVYDDVAEVNGQILKTGRLLRRLDALDIYHTKSRGEGGTVVCKKGEIPLYVESSGYRGFIISLMEDRETGRDYIMVVNKDYNKEHTGTISVTNDITHLYNCTNGSYEEIDISTGSFSMTFAPGGYALFAVGQQDNIVDRVLDVSDNLAEMKTVSVHAVNPGGGYYAYSVTDGIRDNSNTTALGFRSTQNEGFVTIDLGRALTINRVDLYPTGNLYTRGLYFPEDFTIDVSADGENWTTVVQKTGYTDAQKEIPVFTFDAVEARYVRVNVTKGAAGGGFELAEIEVYNDNGGIEMPDNKQYYAQLTNVPAGTNVAMNKPVTASSQVNSMGVQNVTDGDPGTGWTSDRGRHPTEDGEEWVRVDLAATYTIDRVVLYGRSNDDYFPQKYRIEVSMDGKEFTTVHEGELAETRIGQRPIEIKLEAVECRYVRVTGYVLRNVAGFGDGFLFSLMEMEVYNK